MNSDLVVLIDTREGSKDLINHVPLSVYGQLCSLDSADVLITGNGPTGPVTIGVEVKKVGDLLSSLNTGRLQTQVVRMMDTYTYNYLLCVGVYKPGDDAHSTLLVPAGGKSWRPYKLGNRTIPYGYLESAIVELQLLGITYKQVYDIPTACQWIGVLARWWFKPWNDHSLFRTLDKSTRPNDDGPRVALLPNIDQGTRLRMRVASAFDGMGFERSLSAAQHFPSVVDMVNADRREWLNVPGIGRVLAQSIEESARRKSQ